MAGTRKNRRQFLQSVAAAVLAPAAFPSPVVAQGVGPHIVIVGGGFAGAACARLLKKSDPQLAVTLVEESPVYTAPPMSNAVITGLRDLKVPSRGW